MSTRPSPTAIGAFVVGAIALLLVALLVWGGTDLFRAKLVYVLYFDSVVTGLAAQAAIGDARPVIEDIRRLAAKLDAEAHPLLTSIRSTSDTPRVTLERAQLTLGSVDHTLEQQSPLGFELFQTMRELRAAALALRSLADYLERVPDAPIYGIRRPSGGAK